VIEWDDIYYNRILIFRGHEYWRLITSLLYWGKPNIRSIFCNTGCSFIIFMCESDVFLGLPADYLVFFAFGIVSLWLMACFYPCFILNMPLAVYINYYWAKRWGGIGGWSMLSSVFIGECLFHPERVFREMGFPIAAAHTYFFLHDVVAVRYGLNLLSVGDAANEYLSEKLYDGE
jgi:hypothetical protein